MLNRSRLQWLCRRGTKELDLLLQRYLMQEFERAEVPEQQAFLALLECQDPELTRRLLGTFEPVDSLTPIAVKIRSLGGL